MGGLACSVRKVDAIVENPALHLSQVVFFVVFFFACKQPLNPRNQLQSFRDTEDARAYLDEEELDFYHALFGVIVYLPTRSLLIRFVTDRRARCMQKQLRPLKSENISQPMQCTACLWTAILRRPMSVWVVAFS